MAGEHTQDGNPSQGQSIAFLSSQIQNAPMGGKARDDNGYSLGVTASRGVAENVRKLLAKTGKLQKFLVTPALPQSHLSDLLSDDGRRRFQRWQILEIAKKLDVTEEALLPKTLPRRQLSQPPDISRMSYPPARPDGDEDDSGVYVKSPMAAVIAQAAEEYLESLPGGARRDAMNRIVDAIEKDRRAHPRRLGGE